ncbi:hypoxanthine-guanine phosphoribosyltransferase-like isoform X2 [Bolinopsis microptera]|uniref:hypoxanthine-guanine phosphoribosyltransferase-like isoform X2 n=1 Tax=Bolinopsis microptera TaxID=2820187 RepID=UPI003079D7F2
MATVSADIKKKCLVIPDHSGYDTNMFNIPVKYANFLTSILIPNGLVKDRTQKLAVDILSSLPETKSLVVLCVLKGGYKFCSELVDAMERYICSCEINMSVKVEFIRLKSYHNISSTGEVEVIGLSDLSHLTGKDILIVEDIIDTGRTMTKALKLLKEYSPNTVQCASLLLKRTDKSCGYVPEYVGFTVEDSFIVGFGIDYNEFFRDLPHIGIINEEGIKHFAV